MSQTAKGDVTKQKLLDAAEVLFGDKGYHATSVVEITQKAGVAQGTFYIYFSSKLEIYRTLVRVLTRAVRRAIKTRVAALSHRLSIEREGFRAYFDYAAGHPRLYRIIREAEFVDGELYMNHYRSIAAGYIEGLNQAIAKGEIRPIDADTVAYALMGIGEFLGLRWILWEQQSVQEEKLQSLMDFIYYGIAPRG